MRDIYDFTGEARPDSGEGSLKTFLWTEEPIRSGKALRKKVKRSALGEWKYTKDRDQVIALIKQQEESRVQELLPIRHERMSATPFAFYRAAAIVMADDLSHTPDTGITVQACGDAHISNFGVFASPERRLVFDMNDFDETLPGPWEWDVRRLMTSVEICGRGRGFSGENRKEAILQASRIYREAMRSFSETGNMALWYKHIDVAKFYREHAEEFEDNRGKNLERAAMKALSKNSQEAVLKFTETIDGKTRIAHRPPLLVPLREIQKDPEYGSAADVKNAIENAFNAYRKTLPRERRGLIDQYHIVDVARKVVGVGSVGVRAWIIVMEGISPEDPLVMQIKEAQESVLERYLVKSRFTEHGRRVIEGQRAIQTNSDILLGWTRLQTGSGVVRDYYIRQLWDAKGSVNLEKISQEELTALASMCAWTLAHAHAKTGNRHQIAGYLGKSEAFDHAMYEFARSYADQNENDYEMFRKTIAQQ